MYLIIFQYSEVNNTLLNNAGVKEGVSREITKNFFEVNENKNVTSQNLWNAAKAVLLGKENLKLITFAFTLGNERKKNNST